MALKKIVFVQETITIEEAKSGRGSLFEWLLMATPIKWDAAQTHKLYYFSSPKAFYQSLMPIETWSLLNFVQYLYYFNNCHHEKTFVRYWISFIIRIIYVASLIENCEVDFGILE